MQDIAHLFLSPRRHRMLGKGLGERFLGSIELANVSCCVLALQR